MQIHRIRVEQFLWLFVSVSLIGCAEGSPPGRETFQVSDSAGVEMVRNAAPALQGEEAWSVSPTPELQIGKLEGDAPYLFSSIWNATEAEDGRIIVSESQSYEIRVFSPAGESLGTFGGRGEGPSEFGGPPWIKAATSDTLVVWDPGLYRLSWFDLGGNLLRQVPLRSVILDQPISRFVNGAVWKFRSDGTLLSTGPGDLGFGAGAGLRETTRRFVLIGDGGETVHDFGEAPMGQSLQVRRSDGVSVGVSNPLAPTVQAALGSDPYPVVISGEGAWELQLMGSDGRLGRLIRADIPRLPITEALLDDVRTGLSERVLPTGLTIGQLEDAFSSFPRPDSLQAIGQIEVDGFRNVWVGRRTVDQRVVLDYDIFDSEGRWLTTVRVPAEIERILEIGRDHVLGIWRDELDVPYLRLYRIERPGPRG